MTQTNTANSTPVFGGSTEYGGAFADIIERTSRGHGPDAERKAMLSNCQAPLHVLNSLGVEVPHHEYADSQANFHAFPHSRTLPNGDNVHLHQDVRELTDDGFGDFGSTDVTEEDIVWTVTSLTDETVTLKVVGDWGKARHVPVEEFSEDYEPLCLPDGQPRWGY